MQAALFKSKPLPAIITALLFSGFTNSAFAQVKNSNIYENVLDRYHTATHEWAGIILNHATWLFWTLALISMVWTFGMMALRRADIGEFFAEFVRFTIFTGLFWWLLLNGPRFGESIIASLRQIGGEATRLGAELRPSSVVDIGFDVFFSAVEQSTILSPLASLLTVFLGFTVLILLALVSVNMLILLISAWVLLYGGVFFLGFGGARWTSELAINYYKTVLGVAASLFAMVLIVGVATSVIEQYYLLMTSDTHIKELAVVVVVSFTMAMLVKSIPPLISGIITGASISQAGSMGFGAGTIVGAVGMAAAAAATGGSAIAAGASNAANGAQALMAAYRKSSESTSGNDDLFNKGAGFNFTESSAQSRDDLNGFHASKDAADNSAMRTAGPYKGSGSPQPTASTKVGKRQVDANTAISAPITASTKNSSLKNTAAASRSEDAGPRLDETGTFDKNFLAKGEASFPSMADEVRDFVNRSQSAS